MGNLRRKFCSDYQMDSSDIKFLLNGQRIHDDDTANTLGLIDGDVIEIFTEMSGGGWPSKKNIYGDVGKIQDILANESDNSLDLSDDENDENDLDKQKNESDNVKEGMKTTFPTSNIPIVKIKPCKTESSIMNKEINKETSKETTSTKLTGSASPYMKPPEENEGGKRRNTSEEYETSVIIETDITNQEPIEQTLVNKLRKDYEDGKLCPTNSFDKKIIHFLKLPTLAPVEQQILKNIVDQKHAHRSFKDATDKLFPVTSKKRKRLHVEDNRLDNLREKKSRRIQQLRETSKGTIECSIGDSVNETTNKDCERDNELNIDTPKKREILLKKFEIKTPSPLMKLSKVTEEEMRRFSIAVHLYAEVKFGSTNSLQKVRLKEKNFKEILEFAGPGTRYNLIKGRSVLQYKCLWRNSAKSKNTFRGHPESGFEDELKLHNASKKFCPFEHCSKGILDSVNPLEIDLVLTPPSRFQQRRSDQTGEKSTSRRLFSKNKNSSFNKESLDLEERTAYQMASTPTISHDNRFDADPSPTKEELKIKKMKLLEEIKLVTEKLGKKEGESHSYNTNIVNCKIEDCNKEFTSALGLIKHQKKYHSDLDIQKNSEICCICGKEVVYIDKHLRTVHKDILGDEICEICKQKVRKCDMKTHRGKCIHCPYCGKKEKKKLRLLKHVAICEQVLRIRPEQEKPLDLTSPMKKDLDRNVSEQTIQKKSNGNQDNVQIKKIVQYEECDASDTKANGEKLNQDKETETLENKSDNNGGDISIHLDLSNMEVSLNKKRTKYPFEKDIEEEYMSEYEDNDGTQYTMERRLNKDILEIRLREIDCLQNCALEGDEDIVKQFRLFMQTTTTGDSNEGQFSQSIEPSTVGIYTRSVKNDILKAFHQLFRPFDSRWLLDCTTLKECTFEGEERVFVSPSEPIYLTARVLRQALEKYNSGETGQQRANLVAATRQFMHFIELHFNNKLNLYGREPLERVISYHNGVKSYIESTKIWKTCNKDKKRKLKNNKNLKEYENPNYEAEILEKYKKYLKSPERMDQIKKILRFAEEGAKRPTNKEMTELGKIVMGEIITSTGCRPVVAYRLTVGGWVGKKPGFNPREVTPEDCIVDEEQENRKIYRRLNPTLPPKHLACKHQIENRTAICHENCENKCDPQGFNIHCDWDKTRDTKGSSYLHIAKPIKDIMDLYDLIKTKFFKGRKPDKTFGENWLDDENTPFFLMSSGSPYQVVDFKHLSEDIGVDVTAYSFRQIISTWAISHDSKEIREAEGEALQHSVRVAFDHYVQNKQLQPQKLTQTYIEQEGILPDDLREEIQKTEIKARGKIAETESNRQKKQHKSMLQESEAKKELQRENKPLGPRHRVLGIDRNKLKELVEEIKGENIEVMKQLKPLKWRNFIVRTVCETIGDQGNQLRDIWVKVYKGDLQWGVRDERFRAKEKNWPRRDSNAYMQLKDRNSWIASSILKSLQTDSKVKEKQKYLKLCKE